MKTKARQFGAPLLTATALFLLALTGCAGATDDSAPGDNGTEEAQGATASSEEAVKKRPRCRTTGDWNLPGITGEFCTESNSACDAEGGGCEKSVICTGTYRVAPSNYKFTKDAFGACPARGTIINIEKAYRSGGVSGGNTLIGFRVTSNWGTCGGAGLY
jgi:hypothetical protein